jgi:uncharacterized membrane protein
MEEHQSGRPHKLFRLGVYLKGAQGLIQIILSVLVFLIPLGVIVGVANHVTEIELIHRHGDFVATWLMHFAESLSLGTKQFVAFYIFVNGIIDLALAIALYQKRRWAYIPSALVIAGFSLYLFYRFTLHHSLIAIAAALFNTFVVALIIREYRRLGKIT